MNYPKRVNICGVDIDNYSFDEVVKIITHHALSKSLPKYVVTPNAQHIVTLQQDTYFQKIYHNAFLSVPDGVPLLWAAKFFNTPLSGRVNGTDLFEHLCKVSTEKSLKVFLLGGRPGAAERAVSTLMNQYPDLKIAGTYCPPYGFESSSIELEKIKSAVTEASPDILFVGLGAPKQEYWIYENYQDLNVPISIGIGVSFEFVSGMVKRAPLLMQKLGLEWLFRLICEPKRLWRRYVIGNLAFLILVLRHKLSLLRPIT
jgi:N-acetylglucosaminyldiphosphoundecaprenol N-acetyl-beta-D-mannosaminyltransferase